jgi:alpha-ketoglutarate-dependent sulfate ester dioxygenase
MSLSTLPTTDDASVATTPGIRPITGRTGAELSGLDLSDLSDDDVAFIRQALLEHRVVFFRGQALDAGGQIAFASRLGPLTRSHPTLPPLTEDLEVLDLDTHSGNAANQWHTDVTFVERPPTFSVLRAVVIPETGGDTLWANTVAAYADLPDDLRTLADGLRAVHSNAHDYGRRDLEKLRDVLTEEQIAYYRQFASRVYETEHPVVRVHPETKERALMLGGFAYRLLGHSTQESTDIIRILQAYVTRPENLVRWTWREGDVVVWDNRSTQHYAAADFGRQHRKVQRVTTGGVPAVGIEGRRSVALQGDDRDYYRVA